MTPKTLEEILASSPLRVGEYVEVKATHAHMDGAMGCSFVESCKGFVYREYPRFYVIKRLCGTCSCVPKVDIYTKRVIVKVKRGKEKEEVRI